MARYTYTRPPEAGPKRPTAPIWLIVAGGIISLFFALGIPQIQGSTEAPPPGVETYRDGNLLCWDKVVCCKPEDPSTCARIPICEMVDD